MCTEISYSDRRVFDEISYLEENLNFQNPDVQTAKALEILNHLGTILKAESKKPIAANSICGLSGFGLLGLSFYGASVHSAAIVIISSIAILPTIACGLIGGGLTFSLMDESTGSKRELGEIRDFTHLFQNFIANPVDTSVLPLIQSYEQIRVEKPRYSVLMQTLRKAYENKGLNTALTNEWDALLKNYQEISLTEFSKFDALNSQFWNKFNVQRVSLENYERLSANLKQSLHIPSKMINDLVDKLRLDCEKSTYTKCRNATECGATIV